MVRVFRHYIPSSIIWLIMIETILLYVSVYVGVELRFSNSTEPNLAVEADLWIKALTFTLIMGGALTAMGLYQRSHISDFASMMIRLFIGFGLGFLLITLAFYVLPELFLGRGVIGFALMVAFFGIIVSRTFFQKVMSSEGFKSRILVIGSGRHASQVEELRDKCNENGFEIVGYLPMNDCEILVNKADVIKTDDSIFDFALNNGIDEIVVAVDDRRKRFPATDLLNCKMEGIYVRDMVSFFERITGHIQLDALHPSSLIFSTGFSHAVLQSSSKRIFDVVVSAIILILASPIILLTAILIFLSSFGRDPVFYRQIRVGLDNKPYAVLKFRSMRTDAEKDGAQYASKKDSRVTRIGSFIRKTRIDELPQLFNVLKGDMSFVGPRPERPEFVSGYDNTITHYSLRHKVKPGITGWAQICYPYGDTEEDTKQKLQYDLYYVKNYSLFLDFTIMFQTLQVVLFGKGAR
ncbi:MAG: TIGR03013 family PEP-CTERM/XrtA system glycosyltransferase [Gammaproteobacteria bacterium]|nr:TIGR03013 family PEP-CTERM/XrtA system glycosyltransferase [Gammaproteobacteria bacterium]